ncbi:hypothetical protein AB0383_17030 [Amycolatopsis sp. NPDC051373]|uniref:hypothetical protein n=1 Tax=Amycolatopsis sp. NPDC051373 TaxID=3155801 RepID=UPI00344BD450
MERAQSPFANEVPRDRVRGARWVAPTLVGEVVTASSPRANTACATPRGGAGARTRRRPR